MQIEPNADAAEIGLGLRPGLIGRSHGREFLEVCLDFAGEQYPACRLTLAVAAVNRRAIIAYARAEVQVIETLVQRTNGGEHPFLRMERKIQQRNGNSDDDRLFRSSG